MGQDIYIKVILPLKLAWEPYYRTSEEVRAGMRVNVTFAGKAYTAVVSETDAFPDVDPSKILEINAVERHLDPIGEKELELWHFMAEYYLCTIGEVYKMAYPATKTAGETVRARAEERREALNARTMELYRKRIGTLEERLAKKEAALTGRHNAKVTAELEAQRGKILADLEEARGKLEALEGGEGDRSFASLRMTEGTRGMTEGTLSLKEDTLGMEEEKAVGEVVEAFGKGKTVLLAGGAGRTAVFTELIRRTLDAGHNALMLIPEIELSRRLRAELEGSLGDALLVFHSAETAGDRRETASLLLRGDRPRIVLGTRSALFLPFRDLGLVIVEEEHDTAFKQDGAPRYEARDTAVMLGSIYGASVLLASPTPSLESLYNCSTGRYALVRMPLKDGEMEVVDTNVEARKRGMVGNLSRILIRRMSETAEQGGNILVLRPWGPVDDLKEEISGVFPDMSGIAVSTVYEARRKDISDIALLAILNADFLMDKHDFRADEKAMQTLGQFRGRFSGEMLIQTRQGTHPVFTRDDGYIDRLLEERKAFRLPPCSRLVDVVVRDRNAARLARLAALLGEALKGFATAGPFAPYRGRDPEPDTLVLRITLPKDRRLAERKKEIAATVGDFEKARKYPGHITLDVDPV